MVFEVSVDEIKEDILKNVQYDNFILNAYAGEYNHSNFKIPDAALQNVYDYIKFLKEQNEFLKIELEKLKRALAKT